MRAERAFSQPWVRLFQTKSKHWNHGMYYLIPVCAALLLAEAPQDDLLRQLMGRGVPVDDAGEAFVSLPGPFMQDGLDQAAQLEVIRDVAGPRRRLEHLLRDSIVAPFVLKITQLSGGKEDGAVRRVDVSYVAHGDLASFSQRSFLESFVHFASTTPDSRPTRKLTVLPHDALQNLGLKVIDEAEFKQYFLHNGVELFDRVLVRSTNHVQVTTTNESVIIAAAVDPRFTEDDRYPNSWQPIEIGRDGRRQFGQPRPYESSGSYTKITRLRKPPNGLFIEYHQVFVEPHGWFDGKNLLRSKLPLAVQHSVREVRRRLKEKPGT